MKIDRVKLISLMAERNMSANELAKKAGLAISTVSNIRSGKSCANKTGQAIAKALCVELKTLESEVRTYAG